MATEKKLPSYLNQAPVEGRVPGPEQASGASSYLGNPKAGFAKPSAPRKGGGVPPYGQAQPRKKS